jgi:tRNA (mo5U34)-methyltransferase
MNEWSQRITALGNWYHRIDLGNGVVTPGIRNQALVFNVYEKHLPAISGLRVLDLGANACGLSIEFAKRGASVVAVERSPVYVEQARFVVSHLGLSDRIPRPTAASRWRAASPSATRASG